MPPQHMPYVQYPAFQQFPAMPYKPYVQQGISSCLFLLHKLSRCLSSLRGWE
jgi:hypothetical protein